MMDHHSLVKRQLLEQRSQLKAKAILDELKRRNSRVTDVTDWGFKKQAEFIHDPSRLKAAQCTRRAGKSYGIGDYLTNTCLQHPGTTSIYTALTRDSAQAIMYKDVLKVIDRKHQLQMRFREKPLRVVFPNESIIYLLGMDQSEDECRKVLGQKFKLAVVDEAGSFRRDLRTLVYEMLKPATLDLGGTICMVSTTTDIAKGLYYDVVTGKEPGWSVHKWTTADNPYMAEKFADEIAEMKRINPRIIETPGFRRMYLNEWAIDDDKLCYRYNPDRNRISRVPDGNYTNVLGIDLGYDDPTAFVVASTAPNRDRRLFLRDVYKQSGMNISAVEARIRYYLKKYDIERIVIDNAAKQAVKELESRFSIPLTPAEKHGKADFIEIMNSEFILGNVLLADGSEPLSEEYGSLIWDTKEHRRLEHPACDNHAADAGLYAFRHCYNYLYSPVTRIKKTEEEKIEEWLEEEMEFLSERERAQKEESARYGII
jgi:hypothetical protein